MRDALVEGLLRGSVRSWALVAVLWFLTAALVAFRSFASRPRGAALPEGLSSAPSRGPTPLWLFALLGVTTVTSIAALPLASALALPRLRWKTVPSPELVRPSGETWRRLRGPAVQAEGSDSLPDIAVPAIDAGGRWVLFGLLSGAPIQGLSPAPSAPLGAGVPRICDNDAPACRPWPPSWPDPSRPLVLGESTWSKDGSASALAYDVEAGTYLRQLTSPEESTPEATANADPRPMAPVPGRSVPEAMLEVVGRLTVSPPRETTTALFIVRGFTRGRLRAMRVVSIPSGGSHRFYLQRAAADLEAAKHALQYFARPTLWITAFSLPAGLFVYVLAPLFLAVRKRRGAERASESPASQIPSRRAAFASLWPAAAAIATFAAGLAMAAPAAVAIASLWASR